MNNSPDGERKESLTVIAIIKVNYFGFFLFNFAELTIFSTDNFILMFYLNPRVDVQINPFKLSDTISLYICTLF